MKIAAMISASFAVLSALALMGVYRCVIRGDSRTHWYCLACHLWGKR